MGIIGSTASVLRFYRSTDATISTSDTEIGTAQVAGLASQGISSQSLEQAAPTTPGTYHYGACVDAVTDESDISNNCSPAAQVRVPQPVRHPDLEVASLSVSDSSPTVGEPFTLSATVLNSGEGESETTTLRYYQSTDATISAADTEVGTDAVANLAGSGSTSESVELTAPSTPRTLYFGVCVDSVIGESDTTNNCSESVPVDVQATVVEPQGQPDLTVTEPLVSNSDPVTGAQFSLSATVSNTGDDRSAATTLRYYRSTDATISTSDTEVGTDTIVGLGASGSSSQSVDLTAPATAGAYYYGACVDTVTDESDTTNNCSTSVKVDVEEPKYPDLEVGTPTVDESSPETGTTITLSATVSNTGDARSAATTLRYYRSTDATISTSDTEVGTDDVGTLAASGTSAESISLTVPATAGAYYYGACVDTVTDESDTTNNCSASVKVDVEDPKPDLVVDAPSVDDDEPAAEASFTLSATVRNEGGKDAVATTLRYYRSTDATVTSADTEVGTDAVSALAAAGSSDQSVDLTAPDTSGTYYYGACVDTVTDESDTTNNCSTSVAVTVPEPGPSTEISVEDDKKFAPVGGTVDLSARVLDEEGEEITGTTVSWSSSNTGVATVDSSGVMTAVGTGWVTLTATATVSDSSTQSSMAMRSTAADARNFGLVVANSEQTISSSVRMHVVKPVARIEIDPASLSFDTVNDWETLTATLYDDDDNEMRPTYWGWYSANKEVATVNSNSFSLGVTASVQSVGEGSTTVTLSANGSATGTASVTVTLPTARVTASPASLTFTALGDTKTVTVKVLDENGDEDEDATFGYIGTFSPCCGGIEPGDDIKTWDIDKVDDGLEITAEGTGTGRITVCSPSCFRSPDEEQTVEDAVVLVTIYQKPASLTISPDSVNLAVDGTATLRAAIADANGNDIQLAEGDKGGLVVYWETSDSDIATVEGATASATANTGATATVTAAGAGSATITGRWGSSVSGTASVTVTE